MYFTPDDTIVALSSPPGPGGRAVVRLSGPQAVAVASRVFDATTPVNASKRSATAGRLRISEFAALPATLFHFPVNRSLTGQTVVELHTLSSPPIIDKLLADLLSAGA